MAPLEQGTLDSSGEGTERAGRKKGSFVFLLPAFGVAGLCLGVFFFAAHKAYTEPNELSDRVAASQSPAETHPASGGPSAEPESGPSSLDVGLLIDAPGAAFTYQTCTACHGEDLIVRRGRNENGWVRIVGRMMHDYRMPAPSDEEFRVIIGYLSENYPEDTSRPWWRFW
ncbi:MAG: hypothetical protein AAGH60_10350 [Pseudomonadota bacterium]